MKDTLNALEMKNRNRSRVLNLIRHSGASRAEIARATGLTRAAVTLIVDECFARGLLLSGEKNKADGAGRRSTALSINGEHGHCIGLNLSREGYTAGLMDFSGRVRAQTAGKLHGDEPLPKTLERICGDIRALSVKGSGEFLGIGITAPGPLDAQNGVLLKVPNFEKWQGFGLVEYFENEFSCPVLLENNPKALAMAEKLFDPVLSERSYVLFTVDSGLGSGVVLYQNNKSVVYDAELGHTTIDCNGPRCGCGNYGCAELYASMRSVRKAALGQDARFTDWQAVVDLSLTGDKAAQSVVEREAAYLATLIVNCVNCFHTAHVVFFGADIVYRFEHIAGIIAQNLQGRLMGGEKVTLQQSRIRDAEVTSSANLVIEQHALHA